MSTEVAAQDEPTSAVTSVPTQRRQLQCPYCERAFGRVDHLTRHIRSHLQDRPFRCKVCDKAFGRQDLLKRHASCHESDETSTSRRQGRSMNQGPRVSQACKPCAAAKLKCDEGQTCRRCLSKGLVCRRETRQAEFTEPSSRVSQMTPPDGSVDAAENQDEPTTPSVVEQQRPLPLPFFDLNFSDFLSGVMTPTRGGGAGGQAVDQIDWSSADLVLEPMQSQGLLDYRTDAEVHFDDVATGLWDLPISPSQYYESIQQDHEVQSAMPQTEQRGQPTKTLATSIAYKESTLGLWEPSSRDHTASHIKALYVLGESPESQTALSSLEGPSVTRRTGVLTACQRDQMLILTLAACKPENKPAIIKAFPSAVILSKLTDNFFYWHRLQPDSFVHQTSLVIEQMEPELAMTIANMGSTYTDSKVLHSVGFALHEVARVSLPTRFEADNTLTRKLWPIQAFMLDIELGLWSGLKRKMEIAESHRQIPYTMLRRSGRFGKPRNPMPVPLADDAGDILQRKWLAWVQEESMRRLVYHAFIVDSKVSIAMSTTSLISFSELKVPMPQSRDLWLASDAESWKAVYFSRPRNQASISLADCLRDGPELGEDYDMPFCHLIILCGIWGMASCLQQECAVLGKPRQQDAALTLRHQRILEDLHRFQLHAQGDEGDVTSRWDGTAHLLHELILMRLHVPFNEIELFAGKGDQSDARQALPILKEWATSDESRRAIWHAGQVLRAAERFEQAHLRDFFTVGLYQANLALWAYAVLSHQQGPKDDPSPIITGDMPVCLNGPDSPAVHRFFTKSKPAMAALQTMPTTAGAEGVLIPVLNEEAVVEIVLSILNVNFAQWETVPPLVENLYQLLANLGRAAVTIRQ